MLRNKTDVGKVHEVLIEGNSKRSDKFLQGRNTHNKVIVFPKDNFQKGQYVNVLVEECTGGTLVGKAVGRKMFEHQKMTISDLEIQTVKQRFGIIGNSPLLEQCRKRCYAGFTDRYVGSDHR